MLIDPLLLRPLALADTAAVDRLLDTAFGPDRRQRTAYRIRGDAGWIEAFSFAAEADGALAGSVQCWPVALGSQDGERHPLIMVGPVAVATDRQRQGVGQRLMRAALDAIDADRGSGPQTLIGDAPYYGRFGFVAGAGENWALPGPFDPARLLLRNPRAVALPANGTLGPA